MTTETEAVPVFQMCLVADETGKNGWTFSTELPDDTHASPTFTIPWRTDQNFPDPQYIVPGLADRELKNWNLTWAKDRAIFLLDLGADIGQLHFALDYGSAMEHRIRPAMPVSRPYLGKQSEVLGQYRDQHFVALLPLDIHLMDQACLYNKIVLVGRTPMFPPI